MISTIFHALVYDPLYNALVYLVDILPNGEVALAVILLTIVVRIILYPLARRAVETQLLMKEAAPEAEKLKEKFKDNREEQARALFALYRERGIHPFASFGLLLAQLPVIFALYWIFALGGLPEINASLLYSFVPLPQSVDMHFFGLDMAGHSVALGFLAGVAQFFYTRLSMGKRQPPPASTGTSFGADLARSFEFQARFILPATFVVLAFFIPNAAMIYLITSNVVMILQELVAGRRF